MQDNSFHQFCLYQERVLALDSQFAALRRRLAKLRKNLVWAKDNKVRGMVKSQLELALAELSILKEVASFYFKLGKLYDIMAINHDMVVFISRQDPDLFRRMVKEVSEAMENRIK
jgi:hypothetical protein